MGSSSIGVKNIYGLVEYPEKDGKFYRISWRLATCQPNNTCNKKRIRKGEVSSSNHSIRSLFDCSQFRKVSTEVRREIQQDFYVDHMFNGEFSDAQAKLLQNQLIEILKQENFGLKKWNSIENPLTVHLSTKR